MRGINPRKSFTLLRLPGYYLITRRSLVSDKEVRRPGGVQKGYVIQITAGFLAAFGPRERTAELIHAKTVAAETLHPQIPGDPAHGTCVEQSICLACNHRFDGTPRVGSGERSDPYRALQHFIKRMLVRHVGRELIWRTG